MSEIYAQRLAQIVGREGVPEPAAAQELERRLAAGEQPAPLPARALAVLLQTKAVDYLRRWHAHTGSKKPFADVRAHIAGTLAEGGLLDEASAQWALDAWYAALLAPVAAPAARTLGSAPAAVGSAAAFASTRGAEATADDAAGEADEPLFISSGIALPAGTGWRWVRGAWQLFARAWPRWLLALVVIGATLGAAGLAMALTAATLILLPVAGLLLVLVLLGYSLFNAGLLRCAQQVDRAGSFAMSDLFYGFRHRVGAQVGAALLWILLWVAVSALGALAFVLAVGVPASMKDLPALAAMALGGTWLLLWLGALVVAGVALLPLYGAQLMTPALIVLADQPAGAAVMQSIRGSYQNLLPQVVFALIVGGALFAVGFLLGLLEAMGLPDVLGETVLYFAFGLLAVCSTYLAFRDIFYAGADE
ncbi:MAG: hypothetical protein LW847_02515 [Burkholderiales bacterium]|jgi:hypothetical protein|nr:hypothetical protein [Burkholderiales bacterium]